MSGCGSQCNRLALAVVVLIAVLAPYGNAQATAPSIETYQSSRKTIRLERFSPSSPGRRRPVIFVVYGAQGMTARPEALRSYARSLADHGYMAFLIHCFDATESATAGELPVDRARFQRWTKALHDGITFATKDDHVDPHRIGLLGFSLGAFLALWESSQDPRVKAVSEYYGGTSLFMGPPQRMPATLILHGEKDSFVPVEEAKKLQRLLEQQHAPYEVRIYPGQEHGFDGPEGDAASAKDAWARSLAFFDRYLGGH
jgi:carboxymethylenebutenolidase